MTHKWSLDPHWAALTLPVSLWTLNEHLRMSLVIVAGCPSAVNKQNHAIHPHMFYRIKWPLHSKIASGFPRLSLCGSTRRLLSCRETPHLIQFLNNKSAGECRSCSTDLWVSVRCSLINIIITFWGCRPAFNPAPLVLSLAFALAISVLCPATRSPLGLGLDSLSWSTGGKTDSRLNGGVTHQAWTRCPQVGLPSRVWQV